MTSEALGGQLQSCYTDGARPKWFLSPLTVCLQNHKQLFSIYISWLYAVYDHFIARYTYVVSIIIIIRWYIRQQLWSYI